MIPRLQPWSPGLFVQTSAVSRTSNDPIRGVARRIEDCAIQRVHCLLQWDLKLGLLGVETRK